MADLQFTVDYKQLKEANKEISKVGSNAQKSASVFEAAFKRAEAQSVKSARAVRDQITFSQRMERQKVREANAVAAAATKVANEEERLRRKYVEGYAAMDLYSKELNELAVARKADIISAEQQRQAVERLNKQMAAGTGVFSGYGAAQQAATRSSSQMGVVVQQTGYQVGDFLVQIQSGTNPMVAFGQQATQLVGVLPLMASRLGITAAAAIGLSTALGIGIPLLTAIGAAFIRSAESAKDAAEDVTSYKDAIAGLRSELNLLQSGAQSREVLQLNKEIASVENQIYAIKNRTLDLSYADAETKKLILKSAQENSAATDEELQTLQAQLTELNMKKDAIRINTALIGSEAQEQQNLLDNQRHQNRERIEADKKAKEAQEELLKLTLQVANVPAYIPMSATARAAQEANAKMIDGLETAMRLKEQLGEGAYEALRLAGVDMTSGIDSAAKAAARLAADLNISLAAATAMSNMASAEDLVMSQDVVKGRTADRYDVETLLGMGYTREYLLAIGKIKDEKKKGPTSETGQEALDKLVRQAESRRRLVDLTEEQARYEELLFKIQETNATKRDPLSQKELEAAAKKIYLLDEQTRVLEEQNKVQEALASIVESSMENAFMSMVDGTKSVKDAFKSMAAEIIKELYRILVVKRITGMVVGGFGGMTNAAVGGMTNAAVGGGSVGMTAAPVVNPMAGMSGAEMLPQAMGGAWMKGVQMFANGGVVDSPTMFGHSGGVGVMGEAGPEAIMPLKRGANGKLGVSVEGGSGSVVVNNNINVTGGSDPAAIRMEVAKLMPQITSATKSAVIDARRRGGQMKAAFG